MVKLSVRSQEPEWMDTKPVTLETFRHCLQDLCWLNQLSFGYRPTISWLHDEIQYRELKSFRLLDVGFGYGDMLRKIDLYCERYALDAELVGVDLNPYAKQIAEAVAQSKRIRYVTQNVFDYAEPGAFDFIISSLFTHHLDHPELATFLQWQCDTARWAWFSNDIHRHWLPYVALRYFARLARLNELVQNDAPVSVARAFRHRDWQQLMAQVDGHGGDVRIAWYLPFRFGVAWRART